MEKTTLAEPDARLALEVKEVHEEDAFGRRLVIEIEPAAVDERWKAAVEDLRRRLALPGFRKGKVPRDVVEQRFGRSVRTEVVERLLPEAVGQAIREQGLKPIAEPHLHEVEHEAGKPLRFAVHVDVRPALTPAMPAGLKLDKVVHPVKEEDVERVVNGLRERMARYEPADRPAAEGDVVTVDLAELGAGQVPILGRRQENIRFPLVASAVPEPWIAALSGRRPGDTVAVDVPQPAEGELPEPSRARYHQLTLRQVEAKLLPELDDSLAAIAGAGTLPELRAGLRQRLEAEEERRAARAVERDLLDRMASSGIRFEIPDRLVNPAADRLYARVIADMPNLSAPERERIAVEARAAALADVKRELVLVAVAEKERIEVSQEEAEVELQKLEALERQTGEPRRARSGSEREERRERLRDALLERKVLKYLVDTADVQVVEQAATQKRIVTPYDP
jgi:trigger factor